MCITTDRHYYFRHSKRTGWLCAFCVTTSALSLAADDDGGAQFLEAAA
jgi:hypothetical protein